MSEIMLQKIISSQEKLFNTLADIEKAIQDIQNGQRLQYVGQRNLELEIKSVKSELIFLKLSVNDNIIKPLNVLIDDNKKTVLKDSLSLDIKKEFAEARAKITADDIKKFEEAKQDKGRYQKSREDIQHDE